MKAAYFGKKAVIRALFQLRCDYTIANYVRKGIMRTVREDSFRHSQGHWGQPHPDAAGEFH